MPNDLSARLRGVTIDWTSEWMADGEEPRVSLNCRELRAAADLIDAQAKEIERLRTVLAEEQAKPRLKITHITPPPLVIEDDCHD